MSSPANSSPPQPSLKQHSIELPAALLRPSNAWAVVQVGRPWLLITGCWILCGQVTSAYSLAASLLAVGVLQYQLSVVGHHSLHKNLFSRVKFNDSVARYLLLAPLGLPLSITRANHMRHHRCFLEADDYEKPIYDLKMGNRVTPIKLLLWLVWQYLGGGMIAAFQRIFLGRQDAVEKQVRQRKRFSDVREWIPVGLVQGLLFATIWAITGHWWLYSLLWLLPILTLLAGLSATRACLEHADQASHANRWITFQAGFFERQILGPANFNYHAEHHLHAALPACHLPALHRAVLESPLKSELVIEKGYMRRLVGLCRRMAQERKGVSSASSAANPGL